MVYRPAKADPERIARKLLFDLKGGVISRINLNVVVNTCDLDLDRDGGTSPDRRRELIDTVTRRVVELAADVPMARAVRG
jgi:hypothetical protein